MLRSPKPRPPGKALLAIWKGDRKFTATTPAVPSEFSSTVTAKPMDKKNRCRVRRNKRFRSA